jgi:hypothetical protein
LSGEVEICPRLPCPHADYGQKLLYCYGNYRRCPFFKVG